MPHPHIPFSLKHIQDKHVFSHTLSHIQCFIHTFSHSYVPITHTPAKPPTPPFSSHADQKPLSVHPTLQNWTLKQLIVFKKKKIIPSRTRPITKANVWGNSPKAWQEHFKLKSDLLPHLYSLHWEEWDRIPNFGQAKLPQQNGVEAYSPCIPG